MASRSAAEKDGWWPRLGRGGRARVPSCGGMVEVELATTSAVWTWTSAAARGRVDGSVARSCGG